MRQRVEIDGHGISFRRQGAGEIVLLVHGITTYSFIWRKITPQLSLCYDVVAVDLLGCGDSDKPLDISYAIRDHAGYLKAFVDQLGIDHFHFVGHDLGGGIGQIFAARWPDRLDSLSLINSVGYDFWPVQPIAMMRTPIVRELIMSTLDLGVLRLLVQYGLYYKEHVTDALIALFQAPLQSPEGRKAFLHFARCLDNRNLIEIEAQLQQLQMPVLIVRGDADAYLMPTITEQLHRDIPHSRLARIETAGHFIQEDEPEWLVEEVAAFIAGREANYV